MSSLSTETVLLVRHLADSDPASFEVSRLADGKRTEPAIAPSPFGFPVQGRPDSDLMRELQWYLETFLDYPFPPEIDHAERVREALHQWGEQTFDALFGNRAGGRMFDAATQDDYSRLLLRITSDDFRIFSWPWEALRDPEVGLLVQTCQIERRLDQIRDAPPLAKSLPRDHVNILLVTARPYEGDVRFRSFARPLMELIEKEKLPVRVQLLRAPTFDQLRRQLREHPGYYHILHFDGHGSFGSARSGHNSAHHYGGSVGHLVFEDEDGEEDPISAEQLSALLREHAVPAVVLNACQSAMLDVRADDPFASVAAALLRSGMRSVVAMAYSLYVSGAQQFLPGFYRRLFERGSVAEAVRAGRGQMLAHPARICARGEFPLDDWLVPVLYQQEPFDFSFARKAKAFTARSSNLPEEAARERNPYGIIGRDGPLLELERAMRRPPAGILIQGLGGVGKTTLARAFLQWLDVTGGLGEGCFWFSFQDLRSAEFVFNRMGEAIFGSQFLTAPNQQKIEALAAVLRERRFLIVWDNFESAAGIAGTAVQANLSEADLRLLAEFLEKLRRGASKVLITSRSPEEWLGPERRFRLTLGGLEGEERWEYCAAVLRDLGRKIDREDRDLVELMKQLGGHPLAMRVILPRLEKLTAGQILRALKSSISALDLAESEEQARLYATLRFAEQSLPEELQPLLIPLALHEGFLDGNFLEAMAKSVDGQWTRSRIDALLDALVQAGLLNERGQAVYELHPVLTGFLRSMVLIAAEAGTRDAWARAFVEVMARVADNLTPRELHEQRMPFYVHGANFHYAMSQAEHLGMAMHFAALTQVLAAYALHTRNFTAAADLFQCLVTHCVAGEDAEGEAAAYHQLGIIAQEQRDFAAAEQWYRKSLAIDEKQGNEHGAAITYYQLGIIAQEQRDFAAAEQWYRKSLAIDEKQGNEHGAASSYGQLGLLAELTQDIDGAGRWTMRALRAFLRTRDTRNAGIAAAQFLRLYRSVSPEEQAKLKALWEEAGLGPIPHDEGA